MPSVKNPKSQYLRPEAKPYELHELSEGQLRAFNELARLMESSVEAYDAFCKSDRDTGYNPLNKVTLLSGGRGAGKSSLLMTLKNYFSPKSQNKPQSFSDINCKECFKLCETCKRKGALPNALGEDNSVCDECHKICKICQEILNYRLDGRIVWLENLDMELMPENVNLLAAIFARIEEAATTMTQNENLYASTGYGFMPESRKVIQEMNIVKQKIILSWEGNAFSRGPNIDPDTYAAEVYRAEKNRIGLGKKFENLLSELSIQLFNVPPRYDKPIFVLPVEDLDLNPSRCLDILRLIRMITAPNLFIITLGNSDNIRGALNWKFACDFNKSESVKALSSEKYAKINEFASTAFRKLIPPPNRISIEKLSNERTFEFSYGGKDTSIRSFLIQLPVYMNTAKLKKQTVVENTEKLSHKSDQIIACTKINNLAAFLDVRSILTPKKMGSSNTSSSSDERSSHVYCARKMFSLPLRAIHDMWVYLNWATWYYEINSGQPDDKKKFDFCIALAGNLFVAAAREDPNLHLMLSRNVESSFNRDSEGEYQLVTNKFLADNQVGLASSFILEERMLVVHQAKNWLISTKDNENNTTLSDRTSAALILLHDLLSFRQLPGIVGTNLIEGMEIEKWAYTKWELGISGTVEIPWLTPPWHAFWEMDIFKKAWNDTWRWVNQNEHDLYPIFKTDGDIATYFAYMWMKTATILLNSIDRSEDEMNDSFYDFTIPEMSLDEIPDKERTFGCDKFFDENGQFRCINACCKSSVPTMKAQCENIKKRIEASEIDALSWRNFFEMLPKACYWLDLVCKTNELASLCLKGHTNGEKLTHRRRELIRGWLARLACMLTPEAGVSSRITLLFFLYKANDNTAEWSQNPLLQLWMEPDMARMIRTMRAHSAAEFYNRKVFALPHRLFSPKPRKLMYDLTKAFENKVKENKIYSELNLNWAATPEIRKNAMNILGYSMFCPTVEEICTFSTIEPELWEKKHQDRDYREGHNEELYGGKDNEEYIAYKKIIDKYNKTKPNAYGQRKA